MSGYLYVGGVLMYVSSGDDRVGCCLITCVVGYGIGRLGRGGHVCMGCGFDELLFLRLAAGNEDSMEEADYLLLRRKAQFSGIHV